jgi:hypothetical protein
MNKQELIAKIAKDTGATKVGAAAALDSVLDGITKSLKKRSRSRSSASAPSRVSSGKPASRATRRPAPK